MHEQVSFNTRIINAHEAQISAVTQNAFYGRGVWTTIAVINTRLFLWRAHWARLQLHAARAGVIIEDWNETTMRDALAQLIAHNQVETGRARVMILARRAALTREGNTAPSVWNIAAQEDAERPRSDLLIITGAARNLMQLDETESAASASINGLSLTVSPYRTNTLSPLAGLKTTDYLDHILAWEEARAREFDEAVRLNERGEIAGATLANIFWTHKGNLHTPALACGALAGTTRAYVLRLATDLKIPFTEVAHDLTQLADAEEIFLTSAGRGIYPVTTYDFHRYTIHAGSITMQLHEALRQAMLHDD